MAGNFRTKNAAITAKVEVTAGTDVSPTVGANAVAFQTDAKLVPAFDTEETNEFQSSLSKSDSETTRGMARFTGTALLRGCDTAGTAPELSPFYQAVTLGETLTASAITGTAQAGAASAITLAVTGSSAVDDAYLGMPIATTGGTGSGQTAVITAYDGTTKVATVSPAWATPLDATTTYSIYANALYAFGSTGLKNISIYAYDRHSDGASNAVLRKSIGSMGTATLSLQTGALPKWQFSMMGQWVTDADVSDPGEPTYQAARARPFTGGAAYLGGAAIALSDLSLDLGVDVNAFDDPSETYGYDVFQATGRAVTGKITADRTLVSSRAAVADWLAGTKRGLWCRWGSTAGTRFSLWIPKAKYKGVDSGDLRGFKTEVMDFDASGTDAEAYLCIY